MKISVSSYSFARCQSLSQLDCVEAAKKIGFSAIEFTDLVPDPSKENTLEAQKEYAKKIKDKADSLGMDINAYTIGARLFSDTEEERVKENKRVMEQLDVAKILGAKVLRHDVLHQMPKTKRSFDLMVPQIAKNIREIADYAEKLGIKTCVENHGRIVQDSDRVERLFNAVDHPNFGLLVDVGNFACVDEPSQVAVSRLAPYAIHVHAKDMHFYSEKPDIGCCFETRGANWLVGAIVGEGDVPVKKCIDILKLSGYDGYCSIEFEGPEEPIEAITKGFNNLSAMINQ